jgi:hypothetical protein
MGRWTGPLWLACLLWTTASPAADLVRDGDAIELRGSIVAGDGQRFGALLTAEVKTLRVQSAGGDLREALAMARGVLAQQLAIEIDGLCASACAQLLLPAASAVRVADGSVVALHAAADGAVRAARAEGALPAEADDWTRAAWQQLLDLQADIDGFLRAAGASESALAFMQALTSTSNMSVGSMSGTGQGADRQLVISGRTDPLCRVWLLSPAALRDLGVRAADWEMPTRVSAGYALGERADQIYDGMPAAIVPADREQGCMFFRARVVALIPGAT